MLAPRLHQYPKDEGLDDLDEMTRPVTGTEAALWHVPAGMAIPECLQRKLRRGLSGTVDTLVEQGLITSGETLARVLPQMTSGLRAAGITDPGLRELYASIYRAFRRRRSLLLLNLQKQVRIEELPWVACIDRFRATVLALLPRDQVPAFVAWAQAHLDTQPEAFRVRFQPALLGLSQAAQGLPVDLPGADASSGPKARRLLGWCKGTHWLLADTGRPSLACH